MLNRRSWLKFVALAGLMPKMTLADAAKSKILQRSIPSSGERIPAIGMGSWLTFDIGDSQRELGVRVNVLKAFFEQGGGARGLFPDVWQFAAHHRPLPSGTQSG